MASPRYDIHCPVCGQWERVVRRGGAAGRYCIDCRFQWSTEEPEALLIGRAAAVRARQQMRGL